MPVYIDKKACNGCMACVFNCGAFVFSASLVETGQVRIRVTKPSDCTLCLICISRCPRAALKAVFPKKNETETFDVC